MIDFDHDRAKGVRARELLDNPLMVESFAAVKAEYIEAWEKSPARDSEAREKLWVMVKLIDRVKAHLEQMVDNGKLADAELTAIEQRKRFRMFGR